MGRSSREAQRINPSARFFVLCIAVCGACSSPRSLAPGAPANVPLAAPTAAAVLVLIVPRAPSGRGRVHPDTIPTGTQSAGISANGGTEALFPLVSGPNSISVGLPIGSDTITVKLYDALSRALAQATVTQTITAQGPNVVNVAPNGVVSSANLILSPSAFVPGTSSSSSLSVAAFDAAGNPITGAFAVPLTIFNSDTSGHTSLSGTALTGGSSTLNLNYDGTGSSPATLSVTNPGITASVAFVACAHFAYVAMYQSKFAKICTASQALMSTILTPNLNWAMAIDAAGTRAYLSNTSNGVTVIDLATMTVIGAVGGLNFPSGLALNAAATRLFVANQGGSTVSVFDVTGASPVLLGSITVGSTPTGVLVNAGTVYVAVRGASGIANFPATQTSGGSAFVTQGGSPSSLALDPLHASSYVMRTGGNPVAFNSTFSIAGAVVSGTFTVPGVVLPNQIAVHPALARAYVCNGAAGLVVFDTSTNAALAYPTFGAQPEAVAVDPTGAYVYVADGSSNDVTILSSATNTVVRTIPLPVNGVAIGFGP